MHAAIIVRWKTTFNACAPVSRLPPEVMGNIFSLLAELDPPLRDRKDGTERSGDASDDDTEDGLQWSDDPDIYKDDLSSGGCLGWLVASHVCRSWRYTLLELKLL